MTLPSVPIARILVVDDEISNVQLLMKLLRRTGASTVEGVTESALVMDRVREFHPDIVLLDLHMPAPDGYELLAQIGRLAAEAKSYLPVVVITADVTEEAKGRALAAGAADFLTKPFRIIETLLRVGNLIRTRRLHQELAQHNAEIAAELDALDVTHRAKAERGQRVADIVDHLDQHLTIVFQPIVNLATRAIEGYEALSRFSAEPQRPPNEWFADAAEAGLGVRLEVAAVQRALAQVHLVPPASFVSVNVSPDALRSPEFADLITGHTVRPIVIELTEHDYIDDYASTADILTTLQLSGARLAIDDTGAGFASLSHILKFRPQFIKLDRHLIVGLDTDPARASLVGALVSFSEETGARIIAEGIESAAELDKLTQLGVHLGQGFYLARPGPLEMASSASSVGRARSPVSDSDTGPA